jgi:hypothetical protein
MSLKRIGYEASVGGAQIKLYTGRTSEDCCTGLNDLGGRERAGSGRDTADCGVVSLGRTVLRLGRYSRMSVSIQLDGTVRRCLPPKRIGKMVRAPTMCIVCEPAELGRQR